MINPSKRGNAGGVVSAKVVGIEGVRQAGEGRRGHSLSAPSFNVQRAYYLGSVRKGTYEPTRFPQSLNGHGGKVMLDNFDAVTGNLWKMRYITEGRQDHRATVATHGTVGGQPGEKPQEKVRQAQIQAPGENVLTALLAGKRARDALHKWTANAEAHKEASRGGRGGTPREDGAPVKAGGAQALTPALALTSYTDPAEEGCFFLMCVGAEGVTYLAADLTLVQEEKRAQPWLAIPYPRPPHRAGIPAPMLVQLRPHGSSKLLCADESQRTVLLLAPPDASMRDHTGRVGVFNDAWEVIPDEDPSQDLLQELVGSIAGA